MSAEASGKDLLLKREEKYVSIWYDLDDDYSRQDGLLLRQEPI
jgi:hypothetical protein